MSRILISILLTALLGSQSNAAWPDHPIKMVVPFSAGSSSDIVARIVAAKMAEQLGQAIVIDNRGGGSTVIGTDAVAKSAPDGYTIELANTTTHAASAALNPALPFDPVKDFAPVGMIGSAPFVLLGATQVSARTLQEFVALAKARPGELRYASAGTGTLAHLAGELFKSKAAIQLTHVPYRSSAQSMIDLMQARIELSVSTIPPTLQHIREGKLQAFAVMSDKRNPMLADVPTVAEAGLPGCETELWNAVMAPAGLPADIVQRLNRALIAALAAPEVREALLRQGIETQPGPPEALGTRIADEIVKWRAVAAAAGLTTAADRPR